MPILKISGAEYPVSKIFSNEFVFEIPPYQRPYSWTLEEAESLIDDLYEASRLVDLGQTSPYFLGGIVLAKDEDQPEAQVIDGQQRLTTLTILFAALANSLSLQDDRGELRKYLKQHGSHFEGIPDRIRLRIRERDAGFFRYYVQDSESFLELASLDPAQLENDAQRNIRANTLLFVKKLEKLPESEIREFAKFVLMKCFLVAVSTPDSDSAYRIFSILNDRGLDLSPADIFKSEVIGAIADDDEQIKYTERWEDLEDELGVDQFKSLFSHLRTIYTGSKARDSLPKEFRKLVLSKFLDKKVFVDEILIPYGDVFVKIEKSAWESQVLSLEINSWLDWLSRIDNKDWVPAALVYLNLFSHHAVEIEEFLKKLERLASSMYIRRIGANERIERYANLIHEIESGRNVLLSPSALDLSSSEISDTLAQLDGEVYLETRTRMYVLLRLDASKSAGGASYVHKIISVEHVLPQNPPVGSAWLGSFSAAERGYWCHRLANLVLLPRRKNSAARNFDFDTKKKKYFEGPDGASPFMLTLEVLQVPEWNVALLKRRQVELVERLKAIWDLYI